MPDTPIAEPTKVDATTTSLTVSMPVILDANNGNSAILSYHLLIDDGEGGEFRTVGGYPINSMLTEYTVTEGIEKGKTYRTKYRVLNAAGWSDYSDIFFITAATVPAAPPAPTLSSSSATSITLAF